MVGKSLEKFYHRLFDVCERSEPVGHIYKGEIDAQTFGENEVAVVEAVCFTDAPPHSYAVDSMPEAAFGNGDKECHGGVGAPALVRTGNGAKRKCKARKISTCSAKEYINVAAGAKFFFFI